MSVLVAGIGNIFEGDDAFGCEVARELMTRKLPEDVRVVDFGIRGIDLAYALIDKPELTILVDATRQGGSPGDVYTMEPDVEKLDSAEGVSLEAHALDPMRVLRMARSLGGELGRVLLVGCEPQDLGGEDGRMGLTPAVAAAVGEAANIVVDLIQKEMVEV